MNVSAAVLPAASTAAGSVSVVSWPMAAMPRWSTSTSSALTSQPGRRPSFSNASGSGQRADQPVRSATNAPSGTGPCSASCAATSSASAA